MCAPCAGAESVAVEGRIARVGVVEIPPPGEFGWGDGQDDQQHRAGQAQFGEGHGGFSAATPSCILSPDRTARGKPWRSGAI